MSSATSSDSESESQTNPSRSPSPASSASSSSSPPLRPSPSRKLKRKRAVEQEPLPELVGDDEQALSHAEKRRQKKKLAKTGGDSAEPSSADLQTGKPDKAPKNKDSKKKKESGHAAASRDAAAIADADGKPVKRQNSIWVGNLSFKTTPEALRAFFDGCGEITRVNMPMKPPSAATSKWKGTGGGRENKGFAYVDFATPDGKVVAITLSEGHLDGRKLLIKDGNDFAGRPAPAAPADGATPSEGAASSQTKFAKKVLSAQKQPACATLFFGNLSFQTTEASIREMLTAHRKASKKSPKTPTGGDKAEEAGTGADGTDAKSKKDDDGKWIRKVRLGTFEDSGNCKGWAFVDFVSNEDATAALTNPRNYKLDGRDIKIEYASPDAVRRGGGPGARPERGVKRRERGEEEGRKERPGKDEKAAAHAVEEANEEDGQEPPRKRPAREKADTLHVRKGRDGRPRATPGAALALAKRESVAIVPSEGKKIKF